MPSVGACLQAWTSGTGSFSAVIKVNKVVTDQAHKYFLSFLLFNNVSF